MMYGSLDDEYTLPEQHVEEPALAAAQFGTTNNNDNQIMQFMSY